ncbi:hypothetical protein [Ligilactobacillus hayakitensis]|nr:hypothetical protein [Ligilactobacillus hayakitensis]
MIAEITKYAHEHRVSVNVIINQSFDTNNKLTDSDIKILETDIFECQALGVDSVEFSCFTNDSFDEDAATQLLAACGGMACNLGILNQDIPTKVLERSFEWANDNYLDRIYVDNVDQFELASKYFATEQIVLSTTKDSNLNNNSIKQIRL